MTKPTSHGSHTIYTRAMPETAKKTAESLAVVNQVFRCFFADENFVTLLRAESAAQIPNYLRQVLGGHSGNEIV